MRRVSCAWLMVGVCLLTVPVVADSDRPAAVSPGSVTVSQQLAGSCPTFSWGGVAEATGYELVVYRVAENGELQTVRKVNLPRGATTWTPAAAECPVAGSRFAWAVRANGKRGAGQWSDALMFETPGTPSDDEVRQALLLLRRYREGRRTELPAEGQIGGGESERGRVEPQTLQPGATPQSSNRPPEALISGTVGAGHSPAAVITPLEFALSIDGDFDLGGFVFRDGVPFIHNEGGATYGNTAVGLNALDSVYPHTYNDSLRGAGNSGFGHAALRNNSHGTHNTASGLAALYYNTTGLYNTASGVGALFWNSTGHNNTASGFKALHLNTGADNTATGFKALHLNTSGNSNTASGFRALYASTGSLNTGIGVDAGSNWTTGANNIALGYGAVGVAGESGTVRIGGGGFQTRTFIEGINEGHFATTTVCIDTDDRLGLCDIASRLAAYPVCVDTDHKLGVCDLSSRRFKEAIETMGDTASMVSSLRPVTFRFKPREGQSADQRMQYGLIAEEVAEVLPTLVTYDEDGLPRTVRYDLLTPLLLNEIQRQEAEMAEMRGQMADRDRQLADLRRRLEKLAKKKRFRDG